MCAGLCKHAPQQCKAADLKLLRDAGQHWKVLEWLPFGTFTCNMLACAVDFALLALQVAATLTNRQNATTAAIKAGGMGSLSTVSTWAAEVRARAQSAEAWLGPCSWFWSVAGGMWARCWDWD